LIAAPLLVAMLMLPACNLDPDAAIESDEARARSVDKLFSSWDTAETPGAVVAVIRDGKVIYRQAYGMADLERDVPLTPRSIFDIASTSKQFVALSVLLLQEQGKLSLDDDIRDFLPEFPDHGQTITIRHLIHHTSGIRDYMDLMYLAGMKHENSYHPSEIISLVARQARLDFQPGDEFLYSNSGYLLLAAIIERTSGQSLGEFAEERIFKPLGMNHSQFYEDFMRIVENRALSYSQKNTGGYASIQYIFDVVGDTGLLTNTDDLFLWDQNFYDNELGTGGQELIVRMLTPGTLNSGEKLQYAFGLEIESYRGLDVIMHSGSAAGYVSELLRFPGQRFTVIVLSNLAEFRPTKLALQVADLYLADAYTAGPEPAGTESEHTRAARPVAKPDLSAGELSEYGGRYYSSELDATYVVHVADRELRCKLEHAFADLTLVPAGGDEWTADEITLRYLRDSREAVIGFNLSFGRIRDIHFSKMH
jgi:CubicO group peptidase (beta-lactamase class C family)